MGDGTQGFTPLKPLSQTLARAFPGGAPKRSKMNNRKTEVDGLTFDSAKEARRWGELKLLERAGHISGLERQKRFAIDINGHPICHYVSDFTYWQDGAQVVEDVKSAFTRKLPVYRLKAKLMAAVHGVKIVEV
jgi:hypothetical protein